MGIANDIKKLGEDIVASYDTRVKAIGVLVKDTHKMLKGFDAEHKEMSESLRSLLNKGEAIRIKDFKEMLKEIRLRQAERKEEVRKKLDGFRKEQQDMASHWHNITETLAKKKAERVKGGEVREKEEVTKV